MLAGPEWELFAAVRSQFRDSKRDPDLLDKLKAEALGILNWAIQGALMWQAQGLKAPEMVIQASDQYRRDSDPVGEFLDERCIATQSSQATAASMWTEYERWAAANGERPLDRKSFSQKLQARGFSKTRMGHDRTWTWLGVGINPRKAEATVPAATPARADADVKSPLLVN
jgi:putative DNA primase/helicase